MSRKLKFRAWVNGHWVDWLPNSKTLGEYNEVGIYADEYNTEDECFIEQFTGLRDKNGKEVYEGDIVEGTMGIFEVKWYEQISRFSFVPNTNMEWHPLFVYEQLEEMEVIGNIRKNPELLSEGANEQ